MADEDPHEAGEPITACLRRWNAGDRAAADRLFRLVYDELRRIAASHARKERPGHTLQTTAIVHEAYIRIFRDEHVQWRDRAHFFGAASRVMRQLLVDYARGRSRAKRPSAGRRVDLPPDLPEAGGVSMEDVMAIDEALDKLAAVDERKARVVEAHFFGGMTVDETADYLGVSHSTVVRDLKLARGWMYQQMAAGDAT